MAEDKKLEDNSSLSGDQALNVAAINLVQAQRHSILLVEDTAAHAALIRRALDANIWQIEHVTRAEAAVRSFETDPSRIVILDLSLPDRSGLELMERLRRINPSTPVIVVTATDQVTVSVEAMKRGAWDYVVKSDPKESGKLISQAVERAWSRRLQEAQSQLVERSRFFEILRSERLGAIESIVRTVCSEVNNPLSGVVALSQLLQQRGNLDGDLQRLADGIAQSAAKVANVVQKLSSIDVLTGLPNEGNHQRVTSGNSISSDSSENDLSTEQFSSTALVSASETEQLEIESLVLLTQAEAK